MTTLQEVNGLDAVGERKKVTIIGAGVAGLVTAYELERLGHEVEIIEASDRIGGRVHTHRFTGEGSGPFAELGAMRIPSAHRLTLHYIAELGLQDQVLPFHTIFSDDAAYLPSSSGYLRVRDAHDVLVSDFASGVPAGRYREGTLLFGAWLDATIRAIAPRQFYNGMQGEIGVGLLDLVDQVDLTPYRRGDNGTMIDLNAFYAGNPRIRSLVPAHLERFLDDVLDETSSAIVRLRDGMDLIPRSLAARLLGRVTVGQEVTGIEVRDKDVVLNLRQGTRSFSKTCDYVVCTVPFTVLRGMRLSGFDAEKLDIIHETKYWPATKVAFHCREAFWHEDGISGGGSFTGGHVRQTYYPPVDGDPAHGAVMLGSYSIGPDADALSELTEQERVALITQELGVMHPELREPGMVLGVATKAWGEHRWSLGAATIRWEQDSALREAQRQEATRPQRGLFFAGEHCSSKPAWIEGAIESAIDAAHEIEWCERRVSAVFPVRRLTRTEKSA